MVANDDFVEEDETAEEQCENINVASDSGDLVTEGTDACTCVGCSNFNKPKQNETKQNVLYLTAAVKQNNIVEPYSDHGIINIH